MPEIEFRPDGVLVDGVGQQSERAPRGFVWFVAKDGHSVLVRVSEIVVVCGSAEGCSFYLRGDVGGISVTQTPQQIASLIAIAESPS